MFVITKYESSRLIEEEKKTTDLSIIGAHVNYFFLAKDVEKEYVGSKNATVVSMTADLDEGTEFKITLEIPFETNIPNTVIHVEINDAVSIVDVNGRFMGICKLSEFEKIKNFHNSKMDDLREGKAKLKLVVDNSEKV